MYTYLGALVLPNVALFLLWIYLKYLSASSSTSSMPPNIPLARRNSTLCTCGNLKQQRKNQQKLCLRLVYSIDPESEEAFLSRQGHEDTKIVFTFTTEKDKRLFKISLLVECLLNVDSVNDVRLADIFLSESEPFCQLYRLSQTQYMIKLNFLLDNCLNYFDDLVLKADYDYSISRSSTKSPSNLRRRRSSKDNRRQQTTTDLADFRINPRRARKVFIQMTGGEMKKQRNSFRSRSRSPKVLSADDPSRSLRIKQFWIELANKPADALRTRSIASDLALIDDFLFAVIYSAPVSRLGAYYELTKHCLTPDNNRFPDKYIRYTIARMTYAECVAFLALSNALLAVACVLIIQSMAQYIIRGLFIYSLAAVVGCLLASCAHLLLVYIFKCNIQLWMALKPKESRKKRTIFTLAIVVAANGAVLLGGIFLSALQVQLQLIWLNAYLLSLGLFLLTALYLWLLIADIFQYFDAHESNDFSRKRKYRKAFHRMLTERVIIPDAQNSLSGDM